MLKYDVIIIGGGASGLRAAIEAADQGKNLKVCLISKVYPTRSHTGAAQGGMNASVKTVSQDDSPESHAFDTIKGSDYLADQNAVKFMTYEAPALIEELDKWGVPFSRTSDGKIAQRPFGGASFPRTVYSADRTGHVLLHTLFEQALKRDNITFLNEFFLLDIYTKNNEFSGVGVYDIKTGEIIKVLGKALILATGGFARIYWQRSTNAVGNTGDGQAAALRAGIALKDMEFIQFHPTGLAKSGILLSEASRGEGGYLINKLGERFMKKYAPEKMELAPRDIVSRSIEMEIEQGFGIGEGANAYVFLDLRHLGEEKINKKLPQVRQLAIDFEGVDPVKEPVPIRPSAHYCMGGIDIIDYKTSQTSIKGIYAVGECACVSVHGANRLGGNSLTELVVFGKHAGKAAYLYAKERDFIDTDEFSITQSFIESIKKRDGYEKIHVIRNEMGENNWKNLGIFRNEKRIRESIEKIDELMERWEKIALVDKSNIFNTNLIELLELRNMLLLSKCVAIGALNRKESRGGHYREDYKERNDKDYLKHSIISLENGKLELSYKEVDLSFYKPQERKY